MSGDINPTQHPKMLFCSRPPQEPTKIYNREEFNAVFPQTLEPEDEPLPEIGATPRSLVKDGVFFNVDGCRKKLTLLQVLGLRAGWLTVRMLEHSYNLEPTQC